jgi:cell division protein FtsI/penicillin-binding protein 2
LYVNFFAELFESTRSAVFDRTQEEAGDLVLTIEPSVQGYLEEELQNIMKEWHSDLTGGIIMDPKTGAILAMATNPSFDLNEYGKVKDVSIFANPSVQDVYEMGSIVKPLTVAAGLDAGVIRADSTYNDTGSLTMNNKTFWNYDHRALGPGTSMQDILNQSLNTGVAHIVGKMGNKEFADYMINKFHIGEETGIDIPGERQGNVTNLSGKRDLEYAQASFGQGIAITPINMISSLAMLGNGGVTVTPHIVDEIRYVSGRIKKFTPNPPEQVLKPETSEEISRMLVTVVDKALLGGSVKVPEYSIAAKTGTAQIYRPRELGGGYYDDRYLHTFFGYFPAYDPKFIVFLYTKYPKNAEYASHTLTHPFIRTAKFLLHYYGIPPDRASTNASTPRLEP